MPLPFNVMLSVCKDVTVAPIGKRSLNPLPLGFAIPYGRHRLCERGLCGLTSPAVVYATDEVLTFLETQKKTLGQFPARNGLPRSR